MKLFNNSQECHTKFILQNIGKQMVPYKVTAKEVYLNGHTIGFHQQTQKLELHYMSP